MVDVAMATEIKDKKILINSARGNPGFLVFKSTCVTLSQGKSLELFSMNV